MPGPVNVIAGQTGIFRTHGRTAEAMTVRFPAGVLVNLGEVPKSAYPGKLPSTRMGDGAPGPQRLDRRRRPTTARSGRGQGGRRPTATSSTRPWACCSTGKVPVVFAAHRADDLATALRLADEFDLDARTRAWRPRAT